RHTRFSRDWSSDVCSSDLSFALNRVPKRRFGQRIEINAGVIQPLHHPLNCAFFQRFLMLFSIFEDGLGPFLTHLIGKFFFLLFLLKTLQTSVIFFGENTRATITTAALQFLKRLFVKLLAI